MKKDWDRIREVDGFYIEISFVVYIQYNKDVLRKSRGTARYLVLELRLQQSTSQYMQYSQTQPLLHQSQQQSRRLISRWSRSQHRLPTPPQQRPLCQTGHNLLPQAVFGGIIRIERSAETRSIVQFSKRWKPRQLRREWVGRSDSTKWTSSWII